MRVRKGLVGFFGAAGMLMVAASVAWACVSASGPIQGDVVPNKAPVLATAQVTGGSWQPSTPVEVGWAATPGANAEHLATAVTDPSGNLAVSVQVPQVAPGFYYVILTQGAVTQARPFEVSAPGTSAVATQVATATDPATGQAWSGLRADGAQAQGLNSLPAKHAGSSPWMAVGIAGGVTVLFGAVAVAELRRRRVSAHAEIRP